MRESTIEKKVCAYAKSLGWLCYKWSSPSQRGVPDRIFLKCGKFKLVEFKSSIGRVTKLQSYNHSLLENTGFTVEIINSVESGKKLFKKE